MIEIQRNIEKEIKNRSSYKTIFNSTKFKLKILLPFSLLFILFSILYCISPLGFNGNFRILYFIFYLIFLMGFMAFYFFLFVNPYAKGQLEKKGIKTDKGFFRHWANKNYFEYKYSSFRDKLVELKIITESNFDKNSKLLKEYSEYFKNESERIKDFEVFKIAGSAFLVFSLPIWNQLLGIFFNESKRSELDIVLEYSVKFLVLVFVIITLVICIRFFIKEFIENRKRKLIQISNELMNLKWNEDLKNN